MNILQKRLSSRVFSKHQRLIRKTVQCQSTVIQNNCSSDMVIQLQAQNIFFKNRFRYDCVATRPAKNNIKPKSTKTHSNYFRF